MCVTFCKFVCLAIAVDLYVLFCLIVGVCLFVALSLASQVVSYSSLLLVASLF